MNANKRILIVDDDESNRKLLVAMMKILGYEPEVASNGTEALTKFKHGFDLVLLDAMMPGVDGFEVARRIREDAPFKKGDINRVLRVRAFSMPGNLLGVALEDVTERKRLEGRVAEAGLGGQKKAKERDQSLLDVAEQLHNEIAMRRLAEGLLMRSRRLCAVGE
ncbi:MAG: response regulator, partial [Deltaproteobacteria bacterium]|nr:response regulator [Deltaproteobacteria bacterium]